MWETVQVLPDTQSWLAWGSSRQEIQHGWCFSVGGEEPCLSPMPGAQKWQLDMLFIHVAN